MDSHLSLVTLGVTDLRKSTAFYRDKLGWKPHSSSNANISFFALNGMMLALYERDALASDAELPNSEPSKFPGFTLSHNLNSTTEVDYLFDELMDQGIEVLKMPKRTDWGGYSGYFQDLDGYLWEVAYNPFLHVDENGNIQK